MHLCVCVYVFGSFFQWNCNFTYSKRITNLNLVRALPFSDIDVPLHAIIRGTMIKSDWKRWEKNEKQNENGYELIEKTTQHPRTTLFYRPENNSFGYYRECSATHFKWYRMNEARQSNANRSISPFSNWRFLIFNTHSSFWVFKLLPNCPLFAVRCSIYPLHL